jgi:hypothetical protein
MQIRCRDLNCKKNPRRDAQTKGNADVKLRLSTITMQIPEAAVSKLAFKIEVNSQVLHSCRSGLGFAWPTTIVPFEKGQVGRWDTWRYSRPIKKLTIALMTPSRKLFLGIFSICRQKTTQNWRQFSTR